MDDVDMYNYLLVNHDGTIAYVIRQTKPHIVLFDPAEERKKIIGPLTTKGEDTIDLHRGTDGNLYITSNQGNFQITNRKARFLLIMHHLHHPPQSWPMVVVLPSPIRPTRYIATNFRLPRLEGAVF